MIPEQLTDIDKKIISKLHERVKMVIRDNQNIPIRLIKSVAENCSSWVFPVIFKDEDPKLISESCKKLTKHGYLKQFDDGKGYPCFIPPSYSVIETSLRDIKQNDIL